MKRPLHKSPLRGSFHLLWDLNIKAVPTALVWAISFWFVIESRSLFPRTIAIILASLAAALSAVLVTNESGISSKVAWTSLFKDGLTWKLLIPTGVLLDLSLQNLANVDTTHYVVKLIFSAIFLSSLLLWMNVLVVYLPLRTQDPDRSMSPLILTSMFTFTRARTRYVVGSILVLLLAWPIFFIYLFLALTFVHCIIVTSYEDFLDASTLKKRVQVA